MTFQKIPLMPGHAITVIFDGIVMFSYKIVYSILLSILSLEMSGSD